MNAVEIEEAISVLAEQPFNAREFPFAFLEAFGNKTTTIKRLRKGASNKSDLGGVLQTNNIHIVTCPEGEVTKTLHALKASSATTKAKAKFVLATDGIDLEAEELNSGETIACAYRDFPDHFGFFLQLAGITTVKQIRESSFDIKATGRLNKLYVQLLKDNPDWGASDRRPDMNHFMARLIFCFFAEDTDIFQGEDTFTGTIAQMSARDSSNTDEVISQLFEAMNTKSENRADANLPRWADKFPYVNGGLFSGGTEVPRFSRIARSYLIHIGNLDWQKINPDIFGSMIQAVEDDDERGALGMHYTSVPNILKVLNPLFLDDLRGKLDEAGGNLRKLLNLRHRMAKIRVFDPACGSGNFLVIAYKEMRAIEAEINERRNERERPTGIPLTNFRGIEVRDFPAEIARLALIIAEYQCDVLYRGQQEALKEFLPLNAMNWITCGNALHIDWISICPPTGSTVKMHADDLFETPLDQAEIDFENEGGETFICGNPPYAGSSKQSKSQKSDVEAVFGKSTPKWRSLDYVTCWLKKASEYSAINPVNYAFVCTNSICQGEQVPILWPIIYGLKQDIVFARTSFSWANLASRNAGVTVIVVGIGVAEDRKRVLYDHGDAGEEIVRSVSNISAYLVPAERVIVETCSSTLDERGLMIRGHMPSDGGHLTLESDERDALLSKSPEASVLIRPYIGAREYINGSSRFCLWIEDEKEEFARSIPEVRDRISKVTKMRNASTASTTRDYARFGYKFRQIQGQPEENSIILPRITSENREYLPVGVMQGGTIISSQNFALYGEPIWCMALLVSRLHLSWISTVCGRTRTDFAYSNTLGWNTFPVPSLTQKNKTDLTRCAENILLARESYFPATIAELYDASRMDDEYPLVREAHEHNDEVLERIYIGRRFRNDTERLEKLFELYTKMAVDSDLVKTESKRKS